MEFGWEEKERSARREKRISTIVTKKNCEQEANPHVFNMMSRDNQTIRR
jgi:hypothetical protein